MSRAVLNYDVNFYAFRDIKDSLNNFSIRKVVLNNNGKYFDEYWMNMRTWFEKALGEFYYIF